MILLYCHLQRKIVIPLMKTEEFLDFVDDLSQKPSSVIEEEKNMSH